MTRAFLIAGEPSGDALGAALMAGLKTLDPQITFKGIGGAAMAEEGLTSNFPMEELSVMGLAEVLPRYRHLVRRMHETVAAVLVAKPDVLITIDSPDFCLRVAKRVKAAAPDLHTIHYVAPTVWAWRPGRAAKMAPFIDQVLALFPFEPPYMEAEGMRCDFVGHPVATAPQATEADIAAFRAQHNLGDSRLLLVLPGSRSGEVARLAPIFGAALKPVLSQHPDLRLVLPAAAPVAARLQDLTRDWPIAPLILDPTQPNGPAQKRAAFAAADAALAASGTVSLELAAANTPMVIAYDMNWLSRTLIQKMVKIDTATLVNIVTETRTIPECLGADCTPSKIAPALIDLLQDSSRQHAAMAETMTRLGRGGEAPGLRAARAVMEGIS